MINRAAGVSSENPYLDYLSIVIDTADVLPAGRLISDYVEIEKHRIVQSILLL